MVAAMGGIAFQKDLGAVHSLAHPLSAHFGLHHGLAKGSAPAGDAVQRGARAGDISAARRGDGLREPEDDAFIGATEALLRRIGISGGLRAHGINDGALEMLAAAAFADSCHRTNPVPVTQADLLELYRAAL